MNTANDALVHTLTNTKMMLRRFTDDLKPDEYLHRPTPKANCVAWLIGHLTLSDRRTLELLGVKDLPSLPDGFEKRFARDETAPAASEFGDVSALLPIFEKMRDALITTVKKAPLELLNQPTPKPFPMFSTLGELVNFMSVHTAMHIGQITIIRRSLGYSPLV